MARNQDDARSHWRWCGASALLGLTAGFGLAALRAPAGDSTAGSGSLPAHAIGQPRRIAAATLLAPEPARRIELESAAAAAHEEAPEVEGLRDRVAELEILLEGKEALIGKLRHFGGDTERSIEQILLDDGRDAGRASAFAAWFAGAERRVRENAPELEPMLAAIELPTLRAMEQLFANYAGHVAEARGELAKAHSLTPEESAWHDRLIDLVKKRARAASLVTGIPLELQPFFESGG